MKSEFGSAVAMMVIVAATAAHADDKSKYRLAAQVVRLYGDIGMHSARLELDAESQERCGLPEIVSTKSLAFIRKAYEVADEDGYYLGSTAGMLTAARSKLVPGSPSCKEAEARLKRHAKMYSELANAIEGSLREPAK